VPNPIVRGLAWVWTHRLLNDRWRSALMWVLNAKLAAGVTAVIHDESGQVLLLEHAFRGRYPWALPGGWMQRGESPEAAIQREVREETGLDVEIEDVLDARTFREGRLDVIYRCRVTGGVIRSSSETPRWQWCGPDAYPPGTDPYSVELIRLAGLGEPAPSAPSAPAPLVV
jgi:8-oxo-dGTP diphosphatase